MLTPAELLDTKNAASRESEEKLRRDKIKWRKAHDIAWKAVFAAAEGGNVICKDARADILKVLQ